MGCDINALTKAKKYGNFNPRTPGGVRPRIRANTSVYHQFQSTHPGWGATLTASSITRLPKVFQSTHPGWGATPRGGFHGLYIELFQSTHPGWGATKRSCSSTRIRRISIHAPRVGCDPYFSRTFVVVDLFQSTHPGWGATPKLIG